MREGRVEEDSDFLVRPEIRVNLPRPWDEYVLYLYMPQGRGYLFPFGEFRYGERRGTVAGSRGSWLKSTNVLIRSPMLPQRSK